MDLVLCSGGLDSAVVAALAREGGALGPLLFVDYGQPAAREELRAAARLSGWLGVELVVDRVLLPTAAGLSGGGGGIVGARNLALIAHGAAWAISRGCERVLLGATHDDEEGYPDCRPGWVAAADQLCRAAYGVGVAAPLQALRKAEVLAEGLRLGVPIGDTWTCYTPRMGRPCGACAACLRWVGLGELAQTQIGEVRL